MNARKIRRLRKKIESFSEFQIAETFSLFGEPYGVGNLGISIKSDTPKNALHKYWRKEARRFKEIRPNFGCDCPTIRKWGVFQVTNKKTGWKDYFR